MPTENRSSNTENAPCPFCGGKVDPEGWLNGTGQRGPECEGCGATAPSLALWNAARPAQQHLDEPVAVVDEGDDGLFVDLIYGENGNPLRCGDKLYTHADPAEVERLVAANAEYARRHIEQIAEVEQLRAALKFYADREHFHVESGNWDTVSGEPLNILWCGDEPDFIEDGTVARNALSASAVPQVKS